MNGIYGRDYLALSGRLHICIPKPRAAALRALPWADTLRPFRPLERGLRPLYIKTLGGCVFVFRNPGLRRCAPYPGLTPYGLSEGRKMYKLQSRRNHA